MSLDRSEVPREEVVDARFPAPASFERLGRWLSANAISESNVLAATRLSGGAIQENWRLEMSDGKSLVLRTDSDAAIPTSCTRIEEYRRYRLAFQHGARVARPYGICEDLGIIGKPFFILQFVSGITAGHQLVKDSGFVTDRMALAFELGELIGDIHRTPAEEVTAVLGKPPRSAVTATIDHLRSQLDMLPEANPALDLCLRELELRLGREKDVVYAHGDYRTGNYMVENGKVSAILDWEFSGWGHPLEDLGWFTAPCWRFGRTENGAGGVGPLQSFLDGYFRSTNRKVEPPDLIVWQALAQVKWAVIALHQENRHVSGAQRSLELALSGRLVAGLTLEAMNLLEMR
ncbi:hypothetical protein R69746_06011 [Paraburkholderia aspalathi]|uniref:phosphotransferase family protein n=1 Tax=Paraburkholderia aspalathi TaxID=1324617 RepID=UPI00190D6188|nr:phosphotransferase family protein [Paraburkholderia aspalathi]MBK3842076.1 phosphotransferase family protein [Paraburkholderia aspalathi]CAE6820019.1 hypothetical protein R69746_06011 [Paraburkholderia aspalathi]